MKKLAVVLVSIFLMATISMALNSKPIANFTYEINGYTVHFNATSSYDLDGSIVNYTWDFGDGNVGYGMIIDHIYADEGFYNVSITVIDDSGLNNSTWQIICIDVSPPHTELEVIPSIPNGENGWFISNVTLMLIAQDNFSGVEATYYRINNGNWMKFNGSFMLDDGIYEINYYSEDKAGNEENVKSEEIKIDTTPPYTLCFLSANATNGWYNQILNVSLESYDNLSGIDKTYFRIDKGEYKTYNKSFVIKEEGKHILEYFTKDMAGNAERLI
ncbi:MAG: PKD domain-containing protein, partial [Thermoplasmata archaeon]|nr:PKD domain-containing protein [Thermoplasmata archaeon]